MTNRVMFKVAASALVIALTTVGCKSANMNYRPVATSAKAARADQGSAKFYEQAQAAILKGDNANALILAEKAVELSPRDAGYRMLLGDLYLKKGRFLSAETTFGDVLTLDPNNSRAMLSRVLAQIALGKSLSAVAQLDRLAQTAAPGDVGLAYALAGHPARAVELLEAAARESGANGRVRQNLALAYALAGDWRKARVTAAQDISPADVDARMAQWAAFAQPAQANVQVAALLGVTPTDDAGQPTRLALAPVTAEPVVMVQAEPAPVAVVPAAAPAPIAVAMAPAPARASTPLPVYSAPAKPAAVRVAAAPVRPPVIQAVARPAPVSNYVVQLGAFASLDQAQRGWSLAKQRYTLAGDRTPLTTRISIPGKGTFHRLSVSGFETRGQATQLCATIKAKGGACFVRATAGDTPLQWASRTAARKA